MGSKLSRKKNQQQPPSSSSDQHETVTTHVREDENVRPLALAANIEVAMRKLEKVQLERIYEKFRNNLVNSGDGITFEEEGDLMPSVIYTMERNGFVLAKVSTYRNSDHQHQHQRRYKLCIQKSVHEKFVVPFTTNINRNIARPNAEEVLLLVAIKQIENINEIIEKMACYGDTYCNTRMDRYRLTSRIGAYLSEIPSFSPLPQVVDFFASLNIRVSESPRFYICVEIMTNHLMIVPAIIVCKQYRLPHAVVRRLLMFVV